MSDQNKWDEIVEEEDVDEDAEETSDYEYTYDGGEDDNEKDGNAEKTDEKEYSEENTIGFRYEGDSLQMVIGGSIAMHNILVECKRIARSCFVDISPSVLSATITLHIKNGQRILFAIEFPHKEPYFPAAPPVITMLSKIKSPHDKFNVIFSCIPQLLPSRWNPCIALDEIFKEINKLSHQLTFIVDALDDENSILKDLVAVMRSLYVDTSALYPSYNFASLPSIFVFSKEPSQPQPVKSFSGTGYSTSTRTGKVPSVDTTIFQLSKIGPLLALCKRVQTIQDDGGRDKLNSYVTMLVDNIYLIFCTLISPTITLDEFCRNNNYYKEIIACMESLPAPSEDGMLLLPIAGFSHLLDKSATVRDCLEEEERLLLDRIHAVNSRTSSLSVHGQDQLQGQSNSEVAAEAIVGKKRSSSPFADQPLAEAPQDESGSKIILLEEPFQQHSFLNEMSVTAHLTAKWYRQLKVELASMEDALPNNVRVLSGVSVSQPNLMQLLMFPESEDGPYCGGCFVFDVFIPVTYPAIPPQVRLVTTGYGTVRFNPNLYNCGKVCLSLLGTWAGEPWDPQKSSLAQVINSILFLIFVDEPMFNEPGYEVRRGNSTGDEQSRSYNRHLYPSTLRFAYLDHFKKLNSFSNSLTFIASDPCRVDRKIYELMWPLLRRGWKEKGRKAAERWSHDVPSIKQLITEIDEVVHMLENRPC